MYASLRLLRNLYKRHATQPIKSLYKCIRIHAVFIHFAVIVRSKVRAEKNIMLRNDKMRTGWIKWIVSFLNSTPLILIKKIYSYLNNAMCHFRMNERSSAHTHKYVKQNTKLLHYIFFVSFRDELKFTFFILSIWLCTTVRKWCRCLANGV